MTGRDDTAGGPAERSASVEVRVGPPRRTIAADDEVFVCAPDGSVRPDRQEGYFCADTRVASLVRLTLCGASPQLLDSAVVTPWSARFEYTNPVLQQPGGEIAAGTLHLRVDRAIGRGLHEDLALANHGERTAHLALVLHVEGDYRDLLEVKAGATAPKARPCTTYEGARMTTVYEVADFRRGLIVESPAATAHGTELTFNIVLAPGEHWESCVLWRPIVGPVDPPLPERHCHDLLGLRSPAGRRVRAWRDEQTTQVTTGDPGIDGMLATAVADLSALRLYRPVHSVLDGDDQAAGEAVIVAAGIPWFVAPFGRDALVTSLQTLALSPAIAAGSLRVLAALQAREDDPLHDAEPGKVPHELRHGELAHFHRVPQTPYYGTHDAPALFVLTASQLWRWTGDAALVHRLAPAVAACLAWIDRRGDLDGDGLQEYRPRSGQWGYYNQSWKDAGDAIVSADGELARHPIATCELQGYVVAAKRAWAPVADEVLGEPKEAGRLRDEADRLAEQVEQRYWWADEHLYYLALDGAKRPVRSVASNAGHLLWAGAVQADRAALVGRRLLEEDMWSGWGVRTLSARHPSFNPMSYQRGSVWPHDNAILVEGLLRYGLTAQAWTVARGVLDAGRCFQHLRLPELFAGFTRDEGAFPVQYLGANAPQAWAAGAVVQLLAACAGLAPDAAGRSLHVAPRVPPWLPYLRLDGLRVGGAHVDLTLTSAGTEVRRVAGDLRVEAPDALPAHTMPAHATPVGGPGGDVPVAGGPADGRSGDGREATRGGTRPAAR
jgi:glycogen debranching enzyme